MLIQFKSSIKTTLILLTLIIGWNYLHARNSLLMNGKKSPDPQYYFSQDTVATDLSITKKNVKTLQDRITISDQLTKTPLNFRINVFINYLNFNHFVQEESKKLFFQAWLKEKELQRLLDETDSLRTVYAIASSIQKEVISSLILKAEEKLKALNEEIPAVYQRVREEEDLYWQAASPDEIAIFQEKIRMYKDSSSQVAEFQSGQFAAINAEIPDTITLYNLPTKTAEKKVAVAEGVIYKIQVGAYKGRIPEPANKLIKKLSLIRKVDNYIDDKGVTIYYTGTLTVYQEAVTMQNKVKQEVIKNALITAYQNEKKITVNEARKLNNEL